MRQLTPPHCTCITSFPSLTCVEAGRPLRCAVLADRGGGAGARPAARGGRQGGWVSMAAGFECNQNPLIQSATPSRASLVIRLRQGLVCRWRGSVQGRQEVQGCLRALQTMHSLAPPPPACGPSPPWASHQHSTQRATRAARTRRAGTWAGRRCPSHRPRPSLQGCGQASRVVRGAERVVVGRRWAGLRGRQSLSGAWWWWARRQRQRGSRGGTCGHRQPAAQLANARRSPLRSLLQQANRLVGPWSAHLSPTITAGGGGLGGGGGGG